MKSAKGRIWGSAAASRCSNSGIAAPEKFEVKRLEALEHRNNGMAVFSSSYSASNFTASAEYAVCLFRLHP
jgi:hypothetical protein